MSKNLEICLTDALRVIAYALNDCEIPEYIKSTIEYINKKYPKFVSNLNEEDSHLACAYEKFLDFLSYQDTKLIRSSAIDILYDHLELEGYLL